MRGRRIHRPGLIAFVALGLLAWAAEPAAAIVGGRVVPHASYPQFVSIGCGATLVAPDRIVSAAHCLWGSPGRGREVRVGAERRTVTRVALHPRYVAARLRGTQNPEGEAYDVAVLDLDRPVRSTAPLPLATARPEPGERVRVLGTGMAQVPPRGSPLVAGAERPEPEIEARAAAVPPRGTLRTVDLEALPSVACQQRWRRIGGPFYPRALRSEVMWCAAGGSAEAPRSACLGDSGGPMVVRRGSGWQLAGVVSWGKRCGGDGDPTVATSIPALRAFVTAPAPVAAPVPAGEATLEGAARVGGELVCRGPAWETPPDRVVVQWYTGRRERLRGGADGVLRVGEELRGARVTCAVLGATAGGAVRRLSPPVTVAP